MQKDLTSKALVESKCSLSVGCSEEAEEFRVIKPHRQFNAWKGLDVWHQQLGVQIRLEEDGSVFLSTQEGHVSTIRNATITIEQLHYLISGVTSQK